MRQTAQSGDGPETQKPCPRCKAAALLLAPGRSATKVVVYGCTGCGFAFTPDGAQYTDNLKELKDFFRGATLGQKTFTEGLKGVEMSPAARALLTAQIIEYGTSMWFDGLKQGLLLGALDQNYKAVSATSEVPADDDGKV